MGVPINYSKNTKFVSGGRWFVVGGVYETLASDHLEL